ncbi:UNVERIFIED_ORG: hypothetical protein ABIB19_003003 [Arthrobacter sp. UYEF10]
MLGSGTPRIDPQPCMGSGAHRQCFGAGTAQDLCSKLQAGASEIERQRSNLSRVLDSINWEGPDATHFRGEWSGTHTAALNQVIQALKDAGQKATKNAKEQDQASR